MNATTSASAGLAYPAPWVRAALPTAILRVLNDAPLHGYSLAVALEERGFGRPKGGSLYPVLAQLEAAGAIEAGWSEGEAGPGRRVYQLTAHGKTRLAEESELWRALAAAVCLGAAEVTETR